LPKVVILEYFYFNCYADVGTSQELQVGSGICPEKHPCGVSLTGAAVVFFGAQFLAGKQIMSKLFNFLEARTQPIALYVGIPDLVLFFAQVFPYHRKFL